MSSPTYASPRRTAREGRTGRYRSVPPSAREDRLYPLVIQSSESTMQGMQPNTMPPSSTRIPKDGCGLSRIASDTWFRRLYLRNLTRWKRLPRKESQRAAEDSFVIPADHSFYHIAATTPPLALLVPCFPWQSSCGPSPE